MSPAEQPNPAVLRRRLLRWYERNRRRLPWREDPDPYHVLVSEVMLQQTRVAVVIPYYRRFVERFPSLQALAAAEPEQVLAAWSGLGYYRRARQLQAAARRIVERHGGVIPRDPSAVRDLPGVGEYTAGALRSIIHGEPEPVVDGNVVRVLARLRALRGDSTAAAFRRRVRAEAAGLLDRRRPGDVNQALMELGATVCTPRQPRCAACPWEHACRARGEGRAQELPERRPRPATRRVRAGALVLRRGGRVLLVRRRGRLLTGLWEFPGDPRASEPRRLETRLRRSLGLDVTVGERLGEVRHGILDRAIRLQVYRGRLEQPPSATAPPGTWRWAPALADEARTLALTGAARRIFRLLRGMAP